MCAAGMPVMLCFALATMAMLPLRLGRTALAPSLTTTNLILPSVSWKLNHIVTVDHALTFRLVFKPPKYNEPQLKGPLASLSFGYQSLLRSLHPLIVSRQQLRRFPYRHPL